jgi:energy-coupling factor transporter ATP-binding protein EcfA2
MAQKVDDAAKNPHSVVRITVEKLFGQFTYELPEKDDLTDVSNLLILYGDNGSGKTTILNLLFHLLSSEDDKGHKTAVSRIRFRRFSVELADGTIIEARRNSKAHDGIYTATILKGTETLESLDFPTGHEGEGRADKDRRLKSFLKHLEKLDLGLHFLPDDRRIQGGPPDDSRDRLHRFSIATAKWINFGGQAESEERSETVELKRAAERATQWIRQQAYKGSNTGQQNVNSIYTDIAKHIADSPSGDVEDIRRKLDELDLRLHDLSAKSSAYSRFGLASDLPVDNLVASMKNAGPKSSTIMYSVLRPYVQSIEARLKALQNIHDIINIFIGNINAFFAGSKAILFDIRGGFTVHAATAERLDLDLLSSGEKQLLLLLFNTLAARDRASILIIDEPEISLNIKWQRRLIQSLLDCIRGSNVQLIFATHSIELLAQHKSHVVKLVNQDPRGAAAQTEESEPNERPTSDDRRISSEV